MIAPLEKKPDEVPAEADSDLEEAEEDGAPEAQGAGGESDNWCS